MNRSVINFMASFFRRHPTSCYLGLLLCLVFLTFWTMLKPGLFSMQDYHTFRLYEFDKCLSDWQIPCRWTPDATFEYGQPTFNFYGQLTYWFGQIFRLVGFEVVDTVKALFISSLVLSAVGMFVLARQVWKNDLSALISALAYTFAPYRAVDVYVRGALPEAIGFVFFPLIIYFFNEFLDKRRILSGLLFGLSFGALILTHNLSAFMLIFLFGVWASYKVVRAKAWKMVPWLILIGGVVLGLVSFYVWPVVFESQFVTIDRTIIGFYNYNNHFATLRQLLLSRFWGYGASVWGDQDGLSLSVGQIQWILPILIAGLIIARKKFKQYGNFWVLFGLGWLMLFLTHNKSVPIWNMIAPMAYIQFPWRFLGLAVFAFSLSIGCLNLLIGPGRWRVGAVAILVAGLVALNTSFFFEDLWNRVDDRKLFSGLSYQDQISSSAGDYYPNFGIDVPGRPTLAGPVFFEGSGSGQLIRKTSNQASYQINIDSDEAAVRMPIAYFPGWVGSDNSKMGFIFPSGDYGLISTRLKKGSHRLDLSFRNTLVRDIGNSLSIVSAGVFGLMVIIFRKKKV